MTSKVLGRCRLALHEELTRAEERLKEFERKGHKTTNEEERNYLEGLKDNLVQNINEINIALISVGAELDRVEQLEEAEGIEIEEDDYIKNFWKDFKFEDWYRSDDRLLDGVMRFKEEKDLLMLREFYHYEFLSPDIFIEYCRYIKEKFNIKN